MKSRLEFQQRRIFLDRGSLLLSLLPPPHDYVIKTRFPEAGVVQGFDCHTVVPSVVRRFSTNLLTSNSSWSRVSTTRRIGALHKGQQQHTSRSPGQISPLSPLLVHPSLLLIIFLYSGAPGLTTLSAITTAPWFNNPNFSTTPKSCW